MHVQVSLTLELSASATLTEMEQQIQEAGQPAMREALKQAIRQFEDQHLTCPHCGEKQRRLEGTARRVIATQFGRVQVPRRRFRCQACRRRVNADVIMRPNNFDPLCSLPFSSNS